MKNWEIWKFEIPFRPVTNIGIPKEYKILHVAEQRGELCLWAEVNPSSQITDLILYIYGTGWPLQGTETKYLGTVCMSDGFVWHVYY
jgi:hypothetical protein